ncbi:lipopolysaccharide heptosyltransferase family protein [Grimontia hollisae]|uniref:ADP-heptose--lipooligosaccharide heptosyltransferase II n=1 Tax=Grimontia hollisae CIP 101886 TaxID=675812 RepID=D0I400_GRIHO|nr:glycosyltransferase family 9 protein [Grimontia hollisae]AMG30455.1 lipopolysaccharide heptosyltransferase family protein [Grimontia hollisae]EEY73778.1 ADP-heptose--lipooligosaccharide heptosyltransferase II [Grimontia hollisae CIP 101886]STO41955.1 Lipopolysaccharide core heptosyltransferase rfaQ [Grimontia hollisae]
MALFTTPPQSLCILRLSAIGDVCNAMAAVQAIQSQWPDTRITWIAGKAEAALLTPLLPDVTVIAFDKKQGIKGMKAVWQSLKGQQFDALLHMQSAIRASVLSLGIKAKYRLGFDKVRASDLQSWFTNIKVPSPASPHVLDGFMAFTEMLGLAPQTPTWKISLAKEDIVWAKAQLRDKPTLIVAPAASKAFKNWTAEGYAAVIEHAMKKGFDVILAGGPGQIEIALGQAIENQLSQPVKNLIGKTTLLQLLALEKEASLVLAPDSGPAHLANAVNTPVIGLYAHHNPARTGPYNWRQYVVSVYAEAIEAETGKTVEQVSWRTRVKDENAMQRITIESVIARFDDVTEKEELL